MNNNIFEPIVIDMDTADAKTVLVLHLLVVVVPIADSDLTGARLNS